MVAFQAILVSFQTRYIASIGTHINALVNIGVWGLEVWRFGGLEVWRFGGCERWVWTLDSEYFILIISSRGDSNVASVSL